MIRTYSELIKLPSFIERYRYLKMSGKIGEDTFGFDRYLNQLFYSSDEWKQIRKLIITRDNGCDLAMDDYDIEGRIIVHHMNPITKDMILERSDYVLNPEYLICVSHNTHEAIHYGDESLLILDPIIRMPNDTCPWRK